VTPLLILSSLLALPATTPDSLVLRDGDCVVFIGSTLIEREQRWGYWEAALTSRFPGKSIRFRNLGWSGDTVWGEAQAGFGTPADGFRHLKEHVLALKPTVIFVGYGTNEGFDGKAGLPRFKKGLKALLDALAPTGARFVFMTPPLLEDCGRPLPDPAGQNENVRFYAEAIRQEAKMRGSPVVDFTAMSPYSGNKRQVKAPTRLSQDDPAPPSPLTDDGMHLTSFGYRWTAGFLLRSLGLSHGNSPQEESGSEFERAEKLRAAIVAKNRLYFHRWRPQNETYLFGFRKHEQGQNSREIPQFDPLVADAEKEIAKLAVPVPHTFELKRDESK
jgi:lysophospholipase L1-like esterase